MMAIQIDVLRLWREVRSSQIDQERQTKKSNKQRSWLYLQTQATTSNSLKQNKFYEN